LLSVHSALSSAPSVLPQHPLEAAKALSSPSPGQSSKKGKGKAKAESSSTTPVAVPYPFPSPPQDAQWKVAFEKPSEITLVGSWANKVSVKAKDDQPWIADISVEMPSVRAVRTQKK
jgi:U3 small nucleolar RNA-associated protein 22